MFKFKFTGYQAVEVTRSEKCLLKKVDFIPIGSGTHWKQVNTLEECVRVCEVKLKIISEAKSQVYILD